MIRTDRKKKISLLLYPSEGGPRYFEIGRSLFKFFLLVPPLGILFCLLVLGLGAVYVKELRSGIVERELRALSSIREENTLLRTELHESRELNGQLQRRLSTPQEEPDALNALSLFAPIQGQRDLREETPLSVGDIRVDRNPGDTRFNFRITNLTEGRRRIRGLVFVVMKTRDSYTLWPASGEGPAERQFRFEEGELFATSRFRPVEAVFGPLAEGESPLFQIVIFSSTGDILHNRFYPDGEGD